MRREAEDDPEIERLARRRFLAAGFREAARRAVRFARLYREEEGAPGGAREVACVAQAMQWRRAARDVRAGLALPGLVWTRQDPHVGERKTG
ncbi:MAG TPA: hypothetical protein VIF62_28350 [Labilithrix sp.]|jgi:hypothetical protein